MGPHLQHKSDGLVQFSLTGIDSFALGFYESAPIGSFEASDLKIIIIIENKNQ